MNFFFLVVFIIYGGMHLYAFFQARAALPFGAAVGIPLALYMVLMTFAPFLVRLLERYDYELAARIFSYIAYCWMAFLFLYFCISIALHGVNLAMSLTGLLGRNSLPSFTISSRVSVLIASGLSLAICIHGYFSALEVRTEHVTVETAKLPAGVDRLKIVQISDVHLGLIVRCGRLRRIMEIVKAEQPDIFVSTGDLVDAQINRMTGMTDLLRQVRAPYGNYAITGNHEYYAGLKQALEFTKNAGFTLLRGQAVTNGVINIVGVDDPTGIQLNIEEAQSEAALLTRLPKNRFTLLLKHRPSVEPYAAPLFDLQLSGHTHRGQIFPFTYISKLAYPMNNGRFQLSTGSVLYVSRGSGTWGPPIRFFSPPEVTVIEIVRKGSASPERNQHQIQKLAG